MSNNTPTNNGLNSAADASTAALPIRHPKRGALERHEETINVFTRASREAGRAFKAIRDNDLYKPDFSTFADYCVSRWGMTSRQVDRIISFYDVYRNLEPHFDELPQNEYQARPLTSLSPQEQLKAWKKVLAENTKGGITGNHVKQVVDAFRQPGAAPRPEGYDDVFDGTDGLRLVLPGCILSDDEREAGFDDFGNVVCKSDLLDELPAYDDLVDAHGAMKRPFMSESALSGIITREWPVVVPALYEDIGLHFQEKDLGNGAFMPVYRTDQLSAPATAPRPDRNEGPEGWHVLVAPGVDLFDPRMPAHVIDDILLAIEAADERWQFFFITARPDRAKQRFPENCWIGTTAWTEAEANAAAKALARVQCSRRFLFAVPKTDIFTDAALKGFDWIVTGALKQDEQPLAVSEKGLSALKRRARKHGCALYLREIRTQHRGLPAPASTGTASKAPASAAPSRPPLPRKRTKLLPPKTTSE